MKEINRRTFFKLVGAGAVLALVGSGCKEEEKSKQVNIRVICQGISFVNADILNEEGKTVGQKAIELTRGNIRLARPTGDFYIVRENFKEGYAMLRVPRACGEEIK